MTPFRFVHAADLHLDSPFQALRAAVPPQIAETLRNATFIALERIVDLCLSEGVDFLLIAGDLYDEADRSIRAAVRVRDQCKRLVDAGVGVFVIHGNHDPLSGWGARLGWPGRVHIFGGQHVEAAPVIRGGQEIARIYGISYRVRDVRDNLASRFRRDADCPWAIGLLHANVGGDPDHEAYAPCALDDLLGAGMDYWALGHVHTRQILHESGPAVVYPGNPQARHARESGPRGCYLVEVDGAGRPHPVFRETDAVRWIVENLSVGDLPGVPELIERLEARCEEVRQEVQGRAAIIRWTLSGRGPLHRDLRRAGTLEDLIGSLRERYASGDSFLWVESIRADTSPELPVAELAAQENFIGDFIRLAQEALADAPLRLRLATALEPLFRDRRARRYLALPDQGTLEAWLHEVVALGIDLLAGEEG